jgi:DNA polymerase III subunit alpha
MISSNFPYPTIDIEARTCNALLGDLPHLGLSNQTRDLYNDRLSWELEYIHNAGLERYIAAVTELVDYAHSLGILVGPGRRSAPSSLVLYLLGVTQIDPIANGLIVERWFSNPHIEIDVELHRREELIDYIWRRYGVDHVAYISTYRRDKETGEILSQEIHVASYAVSSNPIAEVLTARQTDNGRLVVDADREAVEEQGIGILTILGMRQLSAISESVKRIKVTVPSFGINRIPDQDDPTMELFRKGETSDVFQFGSMGMILCESQPANRHDLVLLYATFVPHLFEAGITDTVIHRMSKRFETDNFDGERSPGPNDFDFGAINDLLSETFGILIYQEQFIELVHRLSGWSLLESELYRHRARKNGNRLEFQEEFFTARTETSNSQEEKKRLGSLIASSRNAVLKAHTVSYVRIAWIMGYLKTHYREEFAAGIAKASDCGSS